MTLTHWHRLAACLFAFAMHAEAFAWDEAVDGDLSSLNTAPTPIAFTTGVNVVKGTMGGDAGDGIPVDRDFFTFTLAPNQTVTSINVRVFGPGGASFYAIGPGTSINLSSAATHLSNALISGPGEILPTLAAGPYFDGTGLSNPIGSGTYTVWLQELSSVVTYDFTYTVVTSTNAVATRKVPAMPLAALLALALALAWVGGTAGSRNDRG
jgi:hypothetical protein